MVLLIGIVAGTAFWFITRKVSTAPELVISSVLTGGEAMVIQQVELLEKKENKTTLRLNAAKALFSEDRKKITLTDFSLISYGNEPGAMTILAREGILDSGSNNVEAGGGALVIDEEGRALYAERLHWSNAEKILSSDSPVRIFGDNFLIKGRKLIVETELGRARLSGGVIAVFQNN